MYITPLGATGEVTGSAYLVESKDAKVLIDCGMFQGGKKQEAKNRPPKQQYIKHLDAVLITHAHLDHTGRLPLLVQRDLLCPIYATPATIELSDIVLQDSARIQQGDAERINRKNQRAGLPPIEPLYTPEDVNRTLQLFKPAPYETSFEVAPGISARFVEAGHLLGSISIELTVEENGKRKVLVFSGDIGPRGKPLIRDVELLTKADLVVMESTYGGRDHKSLQASSEEALQVIQETLDKNGKILIPAFAIGRTQELLYALAAAFRNGRLPKFPIYIDSPMAVRSTEVYRKHRELFDEEALELTRNGQLARELDHVTMIESAQESMALNEKSGPLMIIAGSGMCTAGRILHHLRHNLWRPETSVLFVGYQAEGSLGRRLVEGADEVKIFGETIAVKARIATINGFSGHAGQTELVEWFDSLAGSHPRLVITHGEDKSRKALAKIINERYHVRPVLPTEGQTIELN
jgi:metallo-beta-lactamase family protein